MRSTVFPSERSERIISHAARRAAGSKPVVGSSRKMSSGSPTSATPRSRRRFWPPESVLTRAFAFSVEPDERDDLVDVARVRVVAGEHGVRLADGEVRPELGRLEDDADPLPEVGAGPLGIVSEHAHLAAVALAVALEDLDRRRLAGAVRAEEAEDFARLDREVDPAHRLEVPVRLAQAADLDRRHRRRSLDGRSRGWRSWRRPQRSC